MNERVVEAVKRYGFTVVVIIVAAVVLLRFADVETVVRQLSAARLDLFVLGLFMYYATIPVRTRRWRLLLQRLDVETDATSANVLMLLSLFFNTILPAKAGDLYRCHLAKSNYGVDRSTVLGTVAIERAVDLLVLGVGVVASILLLAATVSRRLQIVIALVVATVALVFGAIALVLLLSRSSSAVLARFDSVLTGFSTGIGAISSPGAVLRVSVLTVGIWGLNVLRFGFLSRALALSLSPAEILLVALLVSFLTGIPYTPAGIGFVEVAGTTTLVGLSFSGSAGFALILLDRLITIGSVVLVGGVAYLVLKLTNDDLLGTPSP